MNRFNKAVAFALMSSAALAACANPNKVKQLDTKIEEKGSYMGSTIGVNDDKEAVVQTETKADVELRETGWKVYDLERKIAADHELLTRCRTELADPRLGGSGDVKDIPEIDNMKTPTAVKEEMGLTSDGSLKMVKKEMFMEKLKAQRQYLETLEGFSKTIQKHRGTCEREMGYARVKHGLPAKRYESKGYYEGGRYIQTRRAESNLDDAFAIASEEPAKKN